MTDTHPASMFAGRDRPFVPDVTAAMAWRRSMTGYVPPEPVVVDVGARPATETERARAGAAGKLASQAEKFGWSVLLTYAAATTTKRVKVSAASTEAGEGGKTKAVTRLEPHRHETLAVRMAMGPYRAVATYVLAERAKLDGVLVAMAPRLVPVKVGMADLKRHLADPESLWNAVLAEPVVDDEAPVERTVVVDDLGPETVRWSQVEVGDEVRDAQGRLWTVRLVDLGTRSVTLVDDAGRPRTFRPTRPAVRTGSVVAERTATQALELYLGARPVVVRHDWLSRA